MDENLDQSVVEQAKEFAQTANSANSHIITRIKGNLTFLAGNQYDKRDRALRGEDDERAEMVVHTLRNYCNQVINSFRAKPNGIDLRPRTQNAKAKIDLANGIIKGVEARENGKEAYVGGVDRQVKAGLGYVLVRTDYSGEDTFDQKVCFDSIIKPELVAWDPWDKTINGRAAKQAIIVEHISKRQAEEEFGKDVADLRTGDSFLFGTTWAAPEGSVTVATYFRMTKKKTKIYQDEATGEVIPQEKTRKNDKRKSRETTKTSCEVFKIVGNTVVAQTTLPIDRLPIIPFRGEQVDLADGKTDWYGMVEWGKDPAKLANFTASMIAERIALGIKSQNFVDVDAVEPFLDIASKLNKLHLPFVPLKLWDEKNKRERQMPQTTSYQTQIGDVSSALETSRSILSSVMGQPEGGSNVTGPSNATASEILTKAHSADLASFAYLDNAASSIKEIGRVVFQLLPVIYDTPRILPVKDKSGIEDKEVDLPSMGILPSEFEVDVEAGPLHATQMAEQQGQLLAIASLLGEEGAWALAGRIAKSSAIPEADDLAEYLQSIANTKLGISTGGEDPEAVAALEQASAATDALQEELDRAQLYIQQLQSESQAASIEAKSRIIVARMNNDAKMVIEQMKIASSDRQAQEKLQAEFIMRQKEGEEELLKLYASQPAINVIPVGTPAMPAVGGMRNDIIG